MKGENVPVEYLYENAVFGDYRLVRGLGRGGFADVYLGTDITLDKSVAIKVMNTKVLRQQQINEFKKEARVVACLEHRHIIEVYRYGVEGTIPYIVMKYAPNGSIRSKHPRGALLPLETIVTYVRQVTEALQYSHDQGLIHRDVKPENMLFGSFGEILLSDFGIAILTDSRGADPQDIVGTLAYMAPEQFEARAVRQSDQYSLGIMVYEWLTGDVPFHPKTIYEAAVQHKSATIPSMNHLDVMVPHEVETIILKALAKKPQDRFDSIITFAEALEAVMHRSSSIATIGSRLWTYKDNEAEVLTVAWSPDGSRIMTGNRNGTDRAIDNLTTQTVHIHILDHTPLEFSRPGHLVSTICHIPDLSESDLHPDHLFNKEILNAPHAHITISNRYDENSSLVVSGLETCLFQRWHTVVDPVRLDSEQGIFIAWNHNCSKYLSYCKYSFPTWSTRTTPHGKILLHSQISAILVFLFLYTSSEYDRKPLYKIPYSSDWYKILVSSFQAFAWSRNNGVAAAAFKENGLLIIDLSTNVTTSFVEETHITALAWSPKDRILAAGTDDGHMDLWHIESGKLLSIKVTSNKINAIAWKPDGTQIAIAHGLEVSAYQVG